MLSILRLPGVCIAFVPISPDVRKFSFGAWFGLAGVSRDAVMWGDHPRWSRLGLFGIDLLERTNVDGARPGSRRMSTGLQNLSAEMTGSRHIHSTFHPASRC